MQRAIQAHDDECQCESCCEHDFDINEGYTCLSCGAQGDLGELVDAAEYTLDPDR